MPTLENKKDQINYLILFSIYKARKKKASKGKEIIKKIRYRNKYK